MNVGLTIRIVLDSANESKKFDLTSYNAEEVTFDGIMNAIHQLLPSHIVTSFEYEDFDDFDRITVSNNEGVFSMMNDYFTYGQVKQQPLFIYPKAGKTQAKRNKFDLKVKTKNLESSGIENMEVEGSKKKSGDIQEILHYGSIKKGDVECLEVLGSGNYGTVYRALHKPTKSYMAIKMMSVSSTVNQQQIISECIPLMQCKSNVIISFYGAYVFDDQIVVICTEYMDGGSLDKYKNVPERILGPISVAVLQGIQCLWGSKIMHRDVKPSNILVNTHGRIKLCDFGISVQLINSIAKTFIGTNAYMAPERIDGKDYNVTSEIWSLGVSLFELASGVFPYPSIRSPECKFVDIWKSVLDNEPPQLPYSTFSSDFVDFVSHCMMKDPSLRPAPETLMKHRFILAYEQSDSVMVANWVIHELQQQSNNSNTNFL